MDGYPNVSKLELWDISNNFSIHNITIWSHKHYKEWHIFAVSQGSPGILNQPSIYRTISSANRVTREPRNVSFNLRYSVQTVYQWLSTSESCVAFWKVIAFLTFLSQGRWSDILLNNIRALSIFNPLITLWGHFEAPYFKMLNDARVASACSRVRTCRRVRNSQKIATIRDFHVQDLFFCLSTRIYFASTNFRYTC